MTPDVPSLGPELQAPSVRFQMGPSLCGLLLVGAVVSVVRISNQGEHHSLGVHIPQIDASTYTPDRCEHISHRFTYTAHRCMACRETND